MEEVNRRNEEQEAAERAAREETPHQNGEGDEERQHHHEKIISRSKSHLEIGDSSQYRIVKVDFKVDEEAYLGVEFAYATYSV